MSFDKIVVSAFLRLQDSLTALLVVQSLEQGEALILLLLQNSDFRVFPGSYDDGFGPRNTGVITT